MYHVELRQFPRAAVAFNLSRERLDGRILGPWVAGQVVELQDHRFSPQRARLTIVKGPALAVEAMGLGRGWANAVRDGEKVTDQLLAEARSASRSADKSELGAFKEEISTRATAEPMTLAALVALAGERYPRLRVSDRIALSERAVWELLHEGGLTLRRDGEPVAREEEWEPLLLSWEAWSTMGVSLAARGRG